MRRSITFTILAAAALVMGFPPDAAFSQQKSLREQLVGAWTLVLAEATPAGGAKRQDFGASPKGILILDAGGRYAVVQGSPDRPKFKDAGNLRAAATAEEFAAAARSFAANFGTWSVDEAGKVLIRKYEIALIPNNDGLESKASATVAGDELKLSGTAAGGLRVEAVYRRAK
jgi:hypothetical protein